MIVTIYRVEYCPKAGRYTARTGYSTTPNSDPFVLNGIGFLTFREALSKAHSLNKKLTIVER